MGKNSNEIQACYDIVSNVLRGDNKLIFEWFEQKNCNLGGISPIQLIKTNKVKKLKDFLLSSNFRCSLK